MVTIGTCDCGRRCRAGSDKCASCEALERKIERQSSRVKVVAPIKKITAKRAGQVAQYTKLKREYLALYPVCEVPECNLKSIDVHHQRGCEGERLTDVNYFMAVCRPHHIEFTEHSKKAIEDGHSVSRLSKDDNDGI